MQMESRRKAGSTRLGLRSRRRPRNEMPPPLRSLLSVEPSAELHNRADLLERTGKVAIPYLVDPNTDVAMYESAEIIDYLDRTYASSPEARGDRG